MRKFSPEFIIIIIFMAVSGIAFFFYLQSELRTINSLKIEIASLERAKEVVSEKEPEDPAHLKELFPASGSEAAFIEKAYVIAIINNINDISFNYSRREFIDLASGNTLKSIVQPEKKPSLIYLDSIKMNFFSDYRGLAEFIRELQNLSRLVTIETLSVKNKGTSLAVEMVVNIYSTGAVNAL
jgi:Tfp pilus assembly protein PilO